MMFTDILNTISQQVDSFNAYAAKYPFVAGSLSLWALGVSSYLLRNIPSLIFGSVKKFFTTTITLTSYHESFYKFLKWYNENGFAQTTRHLKLSNGRWGNDGGTLKSLGYGNQFFWFKYRLLFLNMSNKNSDNRTGVEIDQLTITKLGRSHKIFDLMLKEMEDNYIKKDKQIVNFYRDSCWFTAVEQTPRSFETIHITKDIKQQLITHLDKFVNSENWYIQKGIPYQTGILLYGIPGSGKTSIIKAVASYLNYPLYVLEADKLANIQSAVSELPRKSILVIEDIDCNNVVHKRNEITKAGDEDDEDATDLFSKFSLVSIAEILNSIDGLVNTHGRILIITTNHAEKLDPALVRPGRIDLKLEIGYVTMEVFISFFECFFKGYNIPANFKLKENLSPAELQNMILQYNDPEKIISECNQ